jgi:hypothetical protein
MYVGAIHTINDPDAWTRMITDFDPSTLPEGVELLSTGTSEDIQRAVCVWRGPSVEALQTMLDQLLAEISVNDCFALADQYTMIPGAAQSAAV